MDEQVIRTTVDKALMGQSMISGAQLEALLLLDSDEDEEDEDVVTPTSTN